MSFDAPLGAAWCFGLAGAGLALIGMAAVLRRRRHRRHTEAFEMMLIGAVVFDAPTPMHYDLLSLTEQLHCWLRLSTRLSGTMLERSRTVACALGLDMHALCLLSHRRADRRVLGAIAAGRLAMIAALVDLERLRCSSHPEEAQAAFRALREVRECVR